MPVRAGWGNQHVWGADPGRVTIRPPHFVLLRISGFGELAVEVPKPFRGVRLQTMAYHHPHQLPPPWCCDLRTTVLWYRVKRQSHQCEKGLADEALSPTDQNIRPLVGIAGARPDRRNFCRETF